MGALTHTETRHFRTTIFFGIWAKREFPASSSFRRHGKASVTIWRWKPAGSILIDSQPWDASTLIQPTRRCWTRGATNRECWVFASAIVRDRAGWRTALQTGCG